MEGVAHKEGKLVSVLAHHRYPHRPRPVVVEVAQLICQGLDVLRFESRGVLDNVVAGGVHCPLPDGLGDQVEVIPVQNQM